MSVSTHEQSYALHSEHEAKQTKAEKLPSCYSNPNSIDAWRHLRMYESVRPLLDIYPDGTWMTIGDGHYGSDAHFFHKQGVDVLATSLNDVALHIAHEKGYIGQYAAENAEALSVADDSFDFVFCKAAYHHFPRPPIALYEMLRVARRAVVLIEPLDNTGFPLQILKNVFKRVIRKDQSLQFEVSGNFIYRLKIEEINKLMTAANYSHISIRRFNDFFHPNISPKNFDSKSVATILTRLGIATQDMLSRIRLLEYGLGCLVLFPRTPESNLLAAMETFSFKNTRLPVNPYLIG